MRAGEKGNVILLPRTIDYYQMRLTRLLETDRFAEAAELLRFLLQCRTDDERTVEEWRMLLEWMESQRLNMSAGPDGVPAESKRDAGRVRRHAGACAAASAAPGGCARICR